MDEALTKQFRREILNTIQANGGQISWRRLHLVEYQELERMEAEGLIERITEGGTLCQFTYRLRSSGTRKEE